MCLHECARDCAPVCVDYALIRHHQSPPLSPTSLSPQGRRIGNYSGTLIEQRSILSAHRGLVAASV